MQKEYHIKIKKAFAASLIEDLLKKDAVEMIEPESPELQLWQMEALEKELQAFAENPDFGTIWDNVKNRFKQPE